MSEEIDLGKLTDRELLILVVQGVNTHGKRLDSHAESIKSLREWQSYLKGGWAVLAAGLTGVGIHLKGGGH